MTSKLNAQLIEDALRAPNGPAMNELLRLLRQSGLHQLESAELRGLAVELYEQHEATLSAPVKWVLKRLQNAGRQTIYGDYLGLDILHIPSENVSSPQIALDTIRLIDELISHLIEIEELKNHPQRKGLTQRADALLHQCRDLTFGPLQPKLPATEVIRLSLIPESDVRDELIFFRVLQCHELIFHSADVLATRAIELAVHNNAVETLLNLHWVVRLEKLLMPLIGLLAPMSIETWLSFRPLILQPSAIQSMNFHHLSVQLAELRRVLHHPRYPEDQIRYLPLCDELLGEALSLYEMWDKSHTSIARKYSHTQLGRESHISKPAGVDWLETRQSPTATTAEDH